MPHFVRCIDGHVFDAETSPQCPTCGATVDMPPPRTPSPTASPSADANEDHSIAAAAGTQNEAAATPGIGARLAHSAVRIVLVGSMVGVVGGVFVYGALPNSAGRRYQICPLSPRPQVLARRRKLQRHQSPLRSRKSTSATRSRRQSKWRG